MTQTTLLSSFFRPSLAPLSGDGVIGGRSDDLLMLMLLGPAHLGYVCAGHRGPGSGRCEEACLSIHNALVDVARAADTGGRQSALRVCLSIAVLFSVDVLHVCCVGYFFLFRLPVIGPMFCCPYRCSR